MADDGDFGDVVERELGERSDLSAADVADDAGMKAARLRRSNGGADRLGMGALCREPYDFRSVVVCVSTTLRVTLASVSINVPGSPAPPDTSGKWRTATMPGGDEGELLRREAHARRQADGLLGRGFKMLDLARLERTNGGYLVDVDSRELWRHAEGEPKAGRDVEQDAFGLTDPPHFGIRWYRRAPVTLDELLEKDRHAQERAAKAAADELQRRAEQRKHPPARTLTLGDEDRLVGKMSLRQLAVRFEQLAGGVIMVEKDGGLTLRVTSVNENALRLGRALTAASETILVLVRRKAGPVDPDSLPDAELTLGGDLLPGKLLGHGEIEQR